MLRQLHMLLGTARRVLMEYSPGNAIPYVSRVDAGTLELVRSLGVEVLSSADALASVVAAWDADDIASHERAARALERARDGEAVIPRRVGMRLVEHIRRQPEATIGMRPVRSPLTAREWEVVDLLCQGLGTDEMAEALVVSTETVRSHVKHILRKLGARSRAEAVAAAQEMRGAPSTHA
jgi:DNA-binding NarL/FixJ family response regulator